MTEFAPIPGTHTTLRVPPKVLLVGRSYRDAPALVQQLMGDNYLLMSEADPVKALAKLHSTRFEFVVLESDIAGGAAPTFIEALRGDARHSRWLAPGALDATRVRRETHQRPVAARRPMLQSLAPRPPGG